MVGLGHVVFQFLDFWKGSTVSIAAALVYTPPSVIVAPLSHILSGICCHSFSKVRWNPKIVSVCIALRAKDVGHFKTIYCQCVFLLRTICSLIHSLTDSLYLCVYGHGCVQVCTWSPTFPCWVLFPITLHLLFWNKDSWWRVDTDSAWVAGQQTQGNPPAFASLALSYRSVFCLFTFHMSSGWLNSGLHAV